MAPESLNRLTNMLNFDTVIINNGGDHPENSMGIRATALTRGRAQGRQIMNRRATSMMSAMTLLGLAALPQVGFAESDPFLGIWQLIITI